jgi:hypothetical protein
MAVSFRAVGTYVNGTANLTPVIPTGTVAGDIMLCAVGTKPFNGVNTMPAGWVSLGFATNGTVAAGNDVGSMKAEIFYKIHTGTESNPTVTNTTNNVSGAVIISFQKDPLKNWYVGAPFGIAGEFVNYSITNNDEVNQFVTYTAWNGETFNLIVPSQTINVVSSTYPLAGATVSIVTGDLCVGIGGGDDTANTSYSATTNDGIDFQSGDFLVGMIALRSDASTIGTVAISGAGLTISAFTKSPIVDLTTTAGGDMRMSVGRASITAGSASTVLTISATLSGSQTGSSFIVRLRDVDPLAGVGYYDPFGMMGIFGI